jgi:hypothetical protein
MKIGRPSAISRLDKIFSDWQSCQMVEQWVHEHFKDHPYPQSLNHLTRLLAGEHFVELGCHESFKFYSSMLLKLWALLVVSCGENANVYKILVGKPEGGRPLGSATCRWDDIKVLITWDSVVWIYLVGNCLTVSLALFCTCN